MNHETLKQNKSHHVKKIWTKPDHESSESLCDYLSETFEDDLFDLDNETPSFLQENGSVKMIDFLRPSSSISEKMKKLQIAKLDSISIPSTAAQPQHILNLKQSFNFPNSFKPVKENSSQTNQSDLLQCPPLNQIRRPISFPSDPYLSKRVQADIAPTHYGRLVGDCVGNISDVKQSEITKPDLEISEFIPPTGVNCVVIKPKTSRLVTPRVVCKKIPRPQTKYSRRRHIESDSLLTCLSNQIPVVGSDAAKKNDDTAAQVNKANLIKKPQNLHNYEMSSNQSSDCGSETVGSSHTKLCAVVDKLQDQDWEINMDGMRGFIAVAGFVDWESEMGQKFIPMICRKLIDFFKSPRSNLCRTACQTAGDFFVISRTTKRPEFDEMVDLLLSKAADPNRFIQKDAYVALEKMATNICIHHSVRAVCAKGPEHKNSIVRATTARILYIICKKAGVEQIVGSDSNPRTRKRVLTNLAKFLVDKNLETRRHAEKLCKILKPHKFFHEYFFKDVENHQKIGLKKILNSLEVK